MPTPTTRATGKVRPVRTPIAAFLVLAATAATAHATPATAKRFGVNSTISPEVSSNWSGYAALATDVATPIAFSDVTATWRQPKSTCTAGRTSSAAFWVGLGGYDPSSNSLQQLGTAADCNGSSLAPTYYAWWEIVPAPSVQIPITIRPGDTVTAAVLVKAQTVVLSLKDVTRGTRFSKVI